MECTITSPKKTTTYTNLLNVTLPAFKGKMQILPNHAEIFTLLVKGSVFLKTKNNQLEEIKIVSGECYVKNNVITIIL